jgi:hypothetical protein
MTPWYLIFLMAFDRESLPDDAIQPRFVVEPEPPEPAPEPQPLPDHDQPLQKAVAIANPTPCVIPAPTPREIAAKGFRKQDGPTRDQILLNAIVCVARKEQTPVTVAAMRTLIAKFSCECGLGF